MSLFPVVSSLDAVDVNYLTMKTAEGFLVHYHDLQRLEEPGASPTPVIPARDRLEPRPHYCLQREGASPPSESRARGAFTKTLSCFRVSVFARTRATKASFPRLASDPKHPHTSVSAFHAHVTAPYDLDGGNHAKTSSWNLIVRSPHRVAAFRSTTARLLPDPEGRIKSNFSRHSEARRGLSFGSSSSSGIITDHWRRTRGGSTTDAVGPGRYEIPQRDRFGNKVAGLVGQTAPARRGSRRSTDGRFDAFHAPPRNRGTAAFAQRTHRKQPAGKMAAASGNGGDRGTRKKMNWTM
jgi:hypothetical protein